MSDDNALYLGIDKSRLINIDGASIDRSGVSSKKPDLDISKKFILMPSGDELRKNNARAVRGFEQFNSTKDGQYQLVITSRFSDGSKEELNKYSDSILFTGNIPENELQWLFENSELVLFPSEYEGLGLPILEAMSVNKKIACSNIPVFREISNEALFFFDCKDTSSIAKTLSSVLLSEEWQDKAAHYKKILSKYSWENTATKFVNGLKNYDQNQPKFKNEFKKKKLAVLTPHPAGFSAIGKVVSESHASLAEIFDVDYYFDYGVFHREVRPDFLSYVAPCFEATQFNARRYTDYDAVVYHIGNSDYHLESIKNALYLPGIAVLHDTYLDGAFQGLLNTGYISEQRNELEKRLSNLSKNNTSSYLGSVLNNQLAVVTHSKYAAKAVKEILVDEVDVLVSELPVA
ncbi:MAG: glycosyltransferase, partial [Bdellovibrionales bacterium]